MEVGEVQGWERPREDSFDGDGEGDGDGDVVCRRYVQVCPEGNRPRRRDNFCKALRCDWYDLSYCSPIYGCVSE